LGVQHDTTKTAEKVTASNHRLFSELLADLSFLPELSSTFEHALAFGARPLLTKDAVP
jgi:hypothetical protein